MVKPNWDKFKSKFSENPQINFEYFCYLLFCIEHAIPHGIFRHKNQEGIETYPIADSNGDIVGWQSKFYSDSLSKHGSDLIDSINKATQYHPTITKLVFYTNSEFGNGKNGNDPKAKTNAETKAKELNIQLEWRTAFYFESPFVSVKNKCIASHFFSDESIYDQISQKRIHTKRILNTIRSKIMFNSNAYEIDRSDVIKKIESTLENYKVSILSGVGGVGKTAIIKQVYDKIKNDIPFYIFRGTDFKINQIDELFVKHNFENFLKIHKQYTKKIMVIDSAEKLLDINDLDPFKDFITSLLSKEWNIIFTTRHNYLDDLNFELKEILQVIPNHINIDILSNDELANISKDFDFQLPEDNKLLNFIRNPFYLNMYLSLYTDGKTNYKNFKENIWKTYFAKPPLEKCFLDFAFKRAKEGGLYIEIECSDGSLEKLRQNGVLEHETGLGYFISHDIYEELALEKIINREFITKINIEDFLEKIGSSLPIRRAFRNWLSDKLYFKENTDDITDTIIDSSSSIESHWKDELLVSILLSDNSNTFFENFSNELLDNDYALLNRISFLLKIACKEIDTNLLLNLGMKYDEIGSANSLFTQPKGNGWNSYINYIYQNLDTLELVTVKFILPILTDWNNKTKQGNTTKESALIALEYYKLINQEDSYGYDNHIEDICKIVINGSSEIKDDLSSLFDEIITKKSITRQDGYRELIKMILFKSFDSLEIYKNLPNQVLELAKSFWVKPQEKKQRVVSRFSSYENIEVEDAFNLAGKHENDFFPPSAYQTPIYFLLGSHFKITIDFIINFVNESVEHYAKSTCEYKDDTKQVDIELDENTHIRQYHSQALWNMYRGSSSPCMPYLLQSIHMALEKFLLECGKNLKSENLNFLLKKLLVNSRSSSISAIVTSVVLAYPDKTFETAIILFKIKEFIQADFVRRINESQAKSICRIGNGLNPSKDFFERERLEACDVKHRQLHLEHIFLNYQLSRTEDISESESSKRQNILWKILDDYYRCLPNEENQNFEDQLWRIALSRMDSRKMEMEVVETNKEDNSVKIALTPINLGQDLLERQKESENDNKSKYWPLANWARNKIEVNEDYKKFKQFEENPLLALEQIRELLSLSKEDRSSLFFLDGTFSHVCITCLKEYSKKLSSEEKKICIEIMVELANSSISDNYFHELGNGVHEAIEYLPIIINFDQEYSEGIKVILLLILFSENSIGMSPLYLHDYAIKAIKDYLFDDLDCFISAYLALKPKFTALINPINGTRNIDAFIEQNPTEIEKFINDEKLEVDIKTNSLSDLVIAFKMIPSPTTSLFQKELAKNIISLATPKILNSSSRDKEINYELKSSFLKTLANFILKSPTEDTKIYLEQILKEFKPCKEFATLLTEIIYVQDREKEYYDNFWDIWKFFRAKMVNLSKDNLSNHNTNKVIKTYLLAGNIWNDNVTKWHSLTNTNKRFIKKLTEDINKPSIVLYSISKLMTDIGSEFLNDGIVWIAKIISKNSDLVNVKLEENTIYYLEKVIRKYIFLEKNNIKKNLSYKGNVLIILNFLVDKGSVSAYMLRENIL